MPACAVSVAAELISFRSDETTVHGIIMHRPRRLLKIALT
jgi:hypothetical protein